MDVKRPSNVFIFLSIWNIDTTVSLDETRHVVAAVYISKDSQ